MAVGIGKGTKRVMKTKPKQFASASERIAKSRKRQGLPDITPGILGRVRRSRFGRGARFLFTPQTARAKRQLKK